jgi:hypothetical protein
LQSHAVWESYRRSNAVTVQQQATATQRADAVRPAIDLATNAEDLQKRLLALRQEDLRISLDPKRFKAAIPLPTLRRQLLAQLNQAEGQFKARFARPEPVVIERVVRESVRVMGSSLVFSIAFAALGQRRNSSVPFLLELPTLPGRLLASLRPRRARPAQGSAALSFLKSPSRREEEFFLSLAPEEEDPRTHH